jgi:hypothetical protein
MMHRTFLPDTLAPGPSAEHTATAIKNDQVCVCASAESLPPILDAETPRWIERHAFTAVASPREHPVKREKLQGRVSKATTTLRGSRRVGTDHARDALGSSC